MIKVLIFFQDLLLIFGEYCFLFLQFINCKLMLVLFVFEGLDAFGDLLDVFLDILTIFEMGWEFGLELLKFLLVLFYFLWENDVIFLSKFFKFLVHFISSRTDPKIIIFIVFYLLLPLLRLEIFGKKVLELFNFTRVFIFKVFVLLVDLIFVLLAFEPLFKSIF